MNSQPPHFRSKAPGFTLVELMVSVSIIGLIMLVLVSMTNQISLSWRSTTGKIEEFQQARNGFESMTRKLSQATLNTFWDLTYAQINAINTPIAFRRNSELRFISGPMTTPAGVGLAPTPAVGHNYPTHGVFFQAPLGYVDNSGVQDMGSLLNTWGFFVDYADDSSKNPAFLANRPTAWPRRYGWRLTEYQEPSENMSVYNYDNGYLNSGAATGATTGGRHDIAPVLPNPTSPKYPVPTTGSPNVVQLGWYLIPLTGATPPTRVLSENVIALIIWPKLSKQDEETRRKKGWGTVSPKYFYDSSMQTAALYTNPALGVYLNLGASTTNAGDAKETGGIDPKNQLPPILQVTMVALDAASAQRLLDVNGNLVGGLSYDTFTSGLFTLATTTPLPAPGTQSQYDTDLATLEGRLTNPSSVAVALGKAPLKYRVFTTNVAIRGAKWSSYQTN